MAKDKEHGLARHGGLASLWSFLGQGEYTTPNTHVTSFHALLLTTMSASPDDDYDKLSPEEREVRDKADRQREAEEQAGMTVILRATFIYLNYLKALPYSWTQALQDVDIVVPVPKGTRARDLLVVIAKAKLSVGLKGKDPIMAGDLCHEIKVEDSTWTLG